MHTHTHTHTRSHTHTHKHIISWKVCSIHSTIYKQTHQQLKFLEFPYKYFVIQNTVSKFLYSRKVISWCWSSISYTFLLSNIKYRHSEGIANRTFNPHALFKIPYTGKLSSGKTFVFFAVFQSIAKVFPLNHLLCTVHVGHSLMHRESFPSFCVPTVKVFPLESFPVYSNKIMHF